MSWDKKWETIFNEQEWGKYPSEDLIRFIARNFYQKKNRKQIKILEVGCGTGANLWYIAREGFAVYGVDGSKTAISKSINRLDEEVLGWTGELSVGDIIKLPYQDNFFDAVIDVEAIYANTFENSQQIFSEIYRVLKKGGKVYTRQFATECYGDKTGLSVGYNAWLPAVGPMQGKGFTRFATLDDVRCLLSSFDILEIEKLERTYNNLDDRVIEWIATAEKW